MAHNDGMQGDEPSLEDPRGPTTEDCGSRISHPYLKFMWSSQHRLNSVD